MSTNQRLIDLISRDFHSDDYTKQGKATKFTCPFQEACKVDSKNPCGSPVLGDDDTHVMIVAEAPSASKDPRPSIGGKTTPETRHYFFNQSLLRFIEKGFKTIPYFTDLLKCGVPKQTRENKAVFRIRIPNCLERYLFREIEILVPKIILCLGNTSYYTLKKYQDAGKINESIQLVKLVHYSRQGNLSLSDEDKQKFIWPFQAGLLTSEQLEKTPLTNLSFFRKRLNH